VHRHEKLAPESGVEFMAQISGAYVRGVIQKHSVIYAAELLVRTSYLAMHQFHSNTPITRVTFSVFTFSVNATHDDEVAACPADSVVPASDVRILHIKASLQFAEST